MIIIIALLTIIIKTIITTITIMIIMVLSITIIISIIMITRNTPLTFQKLEVATSIVFLIVHSAKTNVF